jgi:hypothetical protein
LTVRNGAAQRQLTPLAAPLAVQQICLQLDSCLRLCERPGAIRIPAYKDEEITYSIPASARQHFRYPGVLQMQARQNTLQ